MAKAGKIAKRLRKGARRALSSGIARSVFEKLITAALIAAAAKLRDSAAAARTGKAAKKAAKAAARDLREAAGTPPPRARATRSRPKRERAAERSGRTKRRR